MIKQTCLFLSPFRLGVITPMNKKSILKTDIPEGELGQWMRKERFTRDSCWKYDSLLEWQHGGQEINLKQVVLAHEKTSSVVGDQKCDESGKTWHHELIFCSESGISV